MFNWTQLTQDEYNRIIDGYYAFYFKPLSSCKLENEEIMHSYKNSFVCPAIVQKSVLLLFMNKHVERAHSFSLCCTFFYLLFITRLQFYDLKSVSIEIFLRKQFYRGTSSKLLWKKIISQCLKRCLVQCIRSVSPWLFIRGYRDVTNEECEVNVCFLWHVNMYDCINIYL